MIHGSLAIEKSTLSLELVTADINGKHVLTPPKDIAEVKNAYEIYECLDELDTYPIVTCSLPWHYDPWLG